MSLKETINENWKAAFKAGDQLKKSVYDFLKQRIIVVEKSGQFTLPLSDEQVVDIIIKECKEREELLKIYQPGDPSYEIAKTALEEFTQYLPMQMSEEEVIEIIKRLKETETNPGKLIGLTVKEVGNRFDKSKIAALVKTLN